MFPEDNIDVFIEGELALLTETRQKDVKNSFSFDYDSNKFLLEDGSPVLCSGTEAIRQWIYKFLCTVLNTLKIYEGYKLGTTVKEMFGKKYLNNGYEESELERQIREGLPLCPGIEKVVSYNSEKTGSVLKLSIGVLLYNGEEAIVKSTIEI